MAKDKTTKYIITGDEFNKFWENVMRKDDPFDHMNVTYYEHDYEKKQYTIKVKDV